MLGTKTIRVLIANDDALVREGLTAIIHREQDMKVVDQVSDLDELLHSVEAHKPDVLLIDLRLGGHDVLSCLSVIRQNSKSNAVLVLSSFDGSEDIYRALRAGVRGYLIRGVPDTEIIQAIRSLSTGCRYIPDDIANRMAERMDGSTLTPRELQVLQLIVKGKSNKDIADQLTITEGTVKFHITSILLKLGVSDRTQAATTAILRGIVHPKEI